MKLTSDIVYEQLAGILNIKKTGPINKKPHLMRPELYVSGISFLSNHLYIAKGDTLPLNPVLEPNCCIFAIGCPPKAYESTETSLLVADSTVDLYQVFNLVQSLFNRLDDWEQALQRCILNAENLQALLDVSKNLFTNPIAIIDESFHVLALLGEHGFDVQDELGDTPNKIVTDIRTDPQWHKFEESEGPYLYQNKLLEHDALCYALRMQGKYAGVVGLTEVYGPNSPGTWALYHELVKYIQLSYERFRRNLDSGTYSLKFICKQLLDGVQLPRFSIERALERLAWSPAHSYSVYCIELYKRDYYYKTPDYIGRHLENLFQHAMAFEHNGNVVMIINSSLIGSNTSKSQSSFSTFVMEGLLKVGISKGFSDIFQFQNYYLQAVAALELGARLRPTQWIRHFDDFCFDYLLEHCSGNLESLSLFPDGLVAMISYDNTHKTEYVKTLQTYFQNKFNTTHSAKALYIHRSTFLERMERIGRFLKLDLNDPDMQIYLMICLKLIK